MEKWDAERGVRLAAEHRASYMIGPPTLFLGMLDVPGCRDQVTTMRVVSCGSTGVTPEFVDAAREGFGAMVKRTYGSTEAPTVTTTCWDDPPEMARDTDGRAVGDAEILVAEPGTVRPVPSGERGEVLVRGSRAVRGLRRAVADGGGGAPRVVRDRGPRDAGPRRVADHRRPAQGVDHPWWGEHRLGRGRAGPRAPPRRPPGGRGREPRTSGWASGWSRSWSGIAPSTSPSADAGSPTGRWPGSRHPSSWSTSRRSRCSASGSPIGRHSASAAAAPVSAAG